MSNTRKPLELTIYPKDEQGRYIVPSRWDDGRWTDADVDAFCWKRFTDAELAAEMWRSYATNGDGDVPFDERLAEWSRVEAWHRFATHPHYDEEQA